MDEELKAMERVGRILDGLDRKAAVRVVRWAADRLDLDETADERSGPAGEDPRERGDDPAFSTRFATPVVSEPGASAATPGAAPDADTRTSQGPAAAEANLQPSHGPAAAPPKAATEPPRPSATARPNAQRSAVSEAEPWLADPRAGGSRGPAARPPQDEPAERPKPERPSFLDTQIRKIAGQRRLDEQRRKKAEEESDDE